MYVPSQEEPSLELLLGEIELQSQTQLMNILNYDNIYWAPLMCQVLVKKGGWEDTTIPSLTMLTADCEEGKQISKETVVAQRDGDKHREPGT